MHGANYFGLCANRQWSPTRRTGGTPLWGQREKLTGNLQSCETNQQGGRPIDQFRGGGSTVDATHPHISARECIRTYLPASAHMAPVSELMSAPIANGRLDLWRITAQSRVWPKKSRCTAGSLRIGRGGAAGLTPKDRAAAPSKVDQIRFRPMDAADVRNLTQAFLLGLLGFVAHAGRLAILFPPSLYSQRKQKQCKKRERNSDSARESRNPVRRRAMHIFTPLPA